MTVNTTENPIKIIVVDDSAFMRKAITIMLESDPAIKVVGTARDGEEAVEKVRSLNPDLVTMDIEMPRMDGLTALREIMTTSPVPVMMVSSLTAYGAQATLEALDLGAVDFIPKQRSYVSLDIVKIKEDLLARIKDIARRKTILMLRHQQRVLSRHEARTTVSSSKWLPDRSQPRISVRKRSHPVGVIAIGSSTGGPPALQQVIGKLPRNLPVGIVVAQHMPPMFTTSLAERLNCLSALNVREATDGEVVEAGTVLIAPGGCHMTIRREAGEPKVQISPEPVTALYKPCVDLLLSSVAETFGCGSLGVILTGMGSNGLEGMRKIRARGGVIIAQNEQTCVVYGMPRAVIDAGLPDHIAAVESIAAEIAGYF